MQVPNQVQEHIDTIAKHEQEFLARRSPEERQGDLERFRKYCVRSKRHSGSSLLGVATT